MNYPRALYPELAKTEELKTLNNMGNDERTMCELCRLIRDTRKDNKRQQYKSVNIIDLRKTYEPRKKFAIIW